MNKVAMQRTIEKELNLHVDVNKWANTSNLHLTVLHKKKLCPKMCELNSESSELFRRKTHFFPASFDWVGNYEGEQRVSQFQLDSKVKSFPLHQEASLADALLHVLSPQLSTWHQMNHHTPTCQTLGTWNNILLRAVGSACIWLQVHEDHSLNSRHPEGVKKKKHRHTQLFGWSHAWETVMAPSREGNQADRITHCLSLHYAFYTREGGGQVSFKVAGCRG